jgi:hypothetical protein
MLLLNGRMAKNRNDGRTVGAIATARVYGSLLNHLSVAKSLTYCGTKHSCVSYWV